MKRRALRANVAVGCTGCHLGEYQGAGTQPRLAGQTKDYLARSMLDFRTGARGNNPGMTDADDRHLGRGHRGARRIPGGDVDSELVLPIGHIREADDP